MCFPHAGRGASLFHSWASALPAVEVWAVQLPGRENRLSEPVAGRVDEIVDFIAGSLAGAFARPVGFFGHSMGALLAFELSRQLQREGERFPIHLFVAGHRAPHLPQRHRPMSTASDEEFIERLVELSGTPAEVLQHDDLRDLVMPTLRADFAVCERYEYRSAARLGCDIDAFSSADDPLVSRDEMDAWRFHTSGRFRLHSVAGNHFDLLDSRSSRVLSRIAEVLAIGRDGATNPTTSAVPR